MNLLPIKTVLISVWDKTNLEILIDAFKKLNIQIIATSGTANYLKNLGIKPLEIEDITGFPHMFDGRVKTLHPSIIGGILMRRDNKNHLEEAKKYNIPQIDMVVVNLYPFEEVAKTEGASLQQLLENIDIGGITLIRAAAKNFHQVVVVTDPTDYEQVAKELLHYNDVTTETRESLAIKAFMKSSFYDAVIANTLKEYLGLDIPDQTTFDDKITIPLIKDRDLRYGENPYQKAAFYKKGVKDVPIEQLHGKELSYNNILDLESAIIGCSMLKNYAACLIMKHTQPCGIAVAEDLKTAYIKALECDPVSAYGGIIGFTKTVDEETAKEVIKEFREIVIAPDYTEKALSILEQKKSLRIIKWFGTRIETISLKSSWLGYLIQEDILPFVCCSPYTEIYGIKEIPDNLLKDIHVGQTAAYLLKSNAISVVKDGKTIGLCGGQTSRIEAVKIALQRAQKFGTLGAILVSDGFFPFTDSVEEAVRSGIKLIVQPGGSIRDKEIIQKAQEYNIAMIITHKRLFRH